MFPRQYEPSSYSSFKWENGTIAAGPDDMSAIENVIRKRLLHMNDGSKGIC